MSGIKRKNVNIGCNDSSREVQNTWLKWMASQTTWNMHGTRQTCWSSNWSPVSEMIQTVFKTCTFWSSEHFELYNMN